MKRMIQSLAIVLILISQQQAFAIQGEFFCLKDSHIEVTENNRKMSKALYNTQEMSKVLQSSKTLEENIAMMIVLQNADDIVYLINQIQIIFNEMNISGIDTDTFSNCTKTFECILFANAYDNIYKKLLTSILNTLEIKVKILEDNLSIISDKTFLLEINRLIKISLETKNIIDNCKY